MVGAGGGHIVVPVAIDAFIAQTVEAQRRFGRVAIGAGGQGMRAEEGETVVLVQFRNIVHQPVQRVVAAGAIRPHGSVVHVGMAGDAIGLRLGKNQALVAGAAIDPDVLAGKGKIRFGMAEPRAVPSDLPAGCFGKNGAAAVPGIEGYLPTGRGVAVGAIDPEGCAVWRLGKHPGCQTKYQYYK